MLVEICPPNLRVAGLAAAITDLVSPLDGRGAEVDLRLPDDLDLPEPAEAVVFRVAQEAVRNIAATRPPGTFRSSCPHRPTASGWTSPTTGSASTRRCSFVGTARDTWRCGCWPISPRRRGAELTIDSTPGTGTRVRLEMLSP